MLVSIFSVYDNGEQLSVSVYDACTNMYTDKENLTKLCIGYLRRVCNRLCKSL